MSAASPEEYIAAQPADRAAMLRALRDIVHANLPAGYVEAMNWGMICYEVPLAIAPKTYNGKPLMYAALANQKGHVGLYLCGLYVDPVRLAPLVEALSAGKKKLDMGKACIRLKSLDQINLDAVGAAIAAVPVEDFVARSAR
jgi:hypothetical protein